jgi:hypothetical protein
MTLSMEKETAPAPGPPAKAVSRRSRAAVARSAGRDRSLLVIIGLVLVAAGALAALLGYRVLAPLIGAGAADRPLLDPVVVDALRAQPVIARIVAIAVGLLLLLLGLVWAARALRPERRPDLVLDRGPETGIVVSSGAAADALAAQAGALPGVGRAKARMVGSDDAPAVRLSLWVTDDADVRDVLDRLDRQVLASARDALGLAALPVAVRVELDQAPTGPRVA